MPQTALNLTEHVLPAVPLRQWVFTLPHPLRARLAYDASLLGAVTRLFVDSVLGWYQRHLRTSTPARAKRRGRRRARASSDLKLNLHLHAVFLDGVYVPGPDGTPEFRALPRLSTTDVADALQVARARILRYLERRGVIALDSDADSDVLCVSEELAERDPALAQLAAAANERLLPGPDGLVRIALKKPFRDGTVAVDLDPLSLLCRLVALGPAPRFHTVRYFGVLAAAAKWRPLVVPKPLGPVMSAFCLRQPYTGAAAAKGCC